MTSIERLTEASERTVEEMNKLLPQLRGDTGHLGSLKDLRAMTTDKNVVLVVARDDGRVIGMGTLYIMIKLGKRISHVEDVVVDESYRGQGWGEKIMRAILQMARDEHVTYVQLTSRPDREAGNKLYQKLGFERRETNVYRLEL